MKKIKTNNCNQKIPKTTPAIVGVAVLLGGTAFASRLLGLIRDRMLAGTFGAGVDLDIYYSAFRIPDLIFTFLVLGALSAGFIPLFTKHWCKKGGISASWRFTNNVIHVLGAFLIAFSVFGAIFTPWILKIIAPGFGPEVLESAVGISRVMYLSTIMLGLSSIFGGVLQGLKRFTLYAIAPLLYNIGIIAGVLVAQWTGSGIEVVAWGVVAGSFLHLLIQIIGSFNSGWRYKFVWDWGDKDVRELLGMMGPRLMGLAVSQVNLIVMTAIASTLAVGSITIFNFANNIQFVPIGIIGISFAIAAFPTLSEYANKKDTKKVVALFSQTARNIIFLILPLSVVFLALRAQIVRVVLGAGVFGWNDTIITANVLGFFVISLFAQSLIPLLVRVYFAYKNTIVPAVIAIISAVINIILAIYWSRTMGVAGIALAFSIANIVQLLMLWIFAHIKFKGLDEHSILNTALIAVAGSVVAALTIQVVKNIYATHIPLTTFFAVLGQGVSAGTAGLLAYLVIAKIWDSKELYVLLSGIKRRLFKRPSIGESADEAVETNY